MGITNLPHFRKQVDNLPAGEVITHEYGLHLFQKLKAHLYEKVGEDEAIIAKLAADPVPNRHAALHGLVCYKTVQSSLNAIIIADFIFHLINCINQYGDAANENEEPNPIGVA